MNMLIYLVKTVLISGLLFGYYWLFLRNRFFHGFNRLFLLTIPALALTLPVLHLSIPCILVSRRGQLPDPPARCRRRHPGRSGNRLRQPKRNRRTILAIRYWNHFRTRFGNSSASFLQEPAIFAPASRRYTKNATAGSHHLFCF